MTVLYIVHMINIMKRVKENRLRKEKEEKKTMLERRRKLTTSYVYTAYREEEVGSFTPTLGSSSVAMASSSASSLAMARWRRKVLRRERSLSMPTLSEIDI